MALQIRAIGADDFDACAWPIFQAVVSAGDTYAYAPDMTLAEARALWTGADARCYVATDDGGIVGTYMLHANQRGPGSHVANCGFMVDAAARGRGIARAMCLHSLDEARRAGFRAMQFNCVVSTNAVAVALWQKLGFAIVGRVPRAFAHPQHGDVDILVMHRYL